MICFNHIVIIIRQQYHLLVEYDILCNISGNRGAYMPKISFNKDYKNALTIYGRESHFNQYYHLETPFSFVLETYYKDEVNEYISLTNFTPTDIKHTIVPNISTIFTSQNRVLHQHDFYEFMYVLDGTVTNSIENTIRIYPKGSGCIVNRNLRHAERFDGNFRVFFLNLSKEYITKMIKETHNLYFAEEQEILDSPILKFLQESENNDVLSNKQFLDIFPVQGNDFAHRCMYKNGESISKTMLSPTFGSSHLIDGYICNILGLICDTTAFHTTHVKLDYNNDFLIFTKLTHLLEDSNQQLSRHELSKLLNYSGDYLNRISKKYSGMTLFEYSMTFIIRKAEYYLLKTDYSISHIISILGFTNRTHFYHIFYSKHHMTPKEYRLKYWDNSYQNN